MLYYTPMKKTPDPDIFPSTFYQTLKEEIILMLQKLFQKIEKEILYHFYGGSITVTPK